MRYISAKYHAWFGFGSSDNSKYMSSEESSASYAIFDSFGTHDLDYAYRKFAPKMYDSIQKLNDLPKLMEAEENAHIWHARYAELNQTYKELLERYDKNQALLEKNQAMLETAQNTILKLSEQIKESVSQCPQR